MRISIKILKNPDLKDLRDIKKIYMDSGWWYKYDNLKRLNKIINNSYIFVAAYLEDRIIGMIRVISDKINDAYIQDFAVLKEYRNNNTGRKLLGFVLNLLKRRNFKWIGLISEKEAVSLYKKFGFKKYIGKIPMIYESKKT